MKTEILEKNKEINWKEFYIKDIFNISRGQRLVENDRLSGELNYYSASQYNNGLTDKISNPLFVEKNALIYTTFGDCFYVSENFTASDEISILKHPELNIFNGLFLVSLIKKNKYKYSFGRKAFLNKFGKDVISLPVKKDGSIDWIFMENYTKKISRKIVFNKKIVKSKSIFKIELDNWADFRIKDLFIFERGERIIESERLEGFTPLITASAYNNGITGLVDFENFKNIKKSFKNKITIDMFCNVFYQESLYFSDDNILTLLFKNTEYNKYYQNKYVNLFLVSVFKKLSSKYSYGRQVRLKRFENEFIKLPINSKKEIDFDFMEQYMKSFNYSELI